MSNWINNLKSEDEQKAKMEQDRKIIASRREEIITYVLKLVRTDAEKVNQLLGDSVGTRKTIEIEINRDFLDNQYRNDFCVLTHFQPLAYLCVTLDESKPCLTRILITQADINSQPSSNTLQPIEIILDDGNFYFLLDGKKLNNEEIAEALIAPVVMYHRDGK